MADQAWLRRVEVARPGGVETLWQVEWTLGEDGFGHLLYRDREVARTTFRGLKLDQTA
ncbi:hypothetical protein [Acrocarpospora sp. B8E8]|uniref:hypothetical protein n=1 Tax=Acrocarpospora sp. B8E8 TaxID=3153572 RepID=UPI00325F8095